MSLTGAGMTDLQEAVSRLGCGPYLDGSISKPGWLYQPMGDLVSELRGTRCHTAAATRRTANLIAAEGGHAGTLIDLGCSTGFYLMRLDGYAHRIGIERDARAAEVARLLNLNVRITDRPDRALHDLRFERLAQPGPVTALALNVHMWWERQGISRECMDAIAGIADRLFFQTAGQDSEGRCTVDYLCGEPDERDYLSQWFGDLKLVDANPHHGGIRRLWRLQAPRR